MPTASGNNIALKQRINEDNMLMTAEIYENAFRSDGSIAIRRSRNRCR